MSETLVDDAAQRRRAEIGGGGLRRRIAGGTIVNTFYLLALNGLSIVQTLLMAGLLGTGEYGLWGLLAISFGTLFALAAIGLDDKYIQQDHRGPAGRLRDRVHAPVDAVRAVHADRADRDPAVLAALRPARHSVPGLLLAAAIPLIALQTPIWVFHRRMDFVKQRVLQTFQPFVTFVVTVALAVSGMGFWSLVIGTLAGSVAATIAAVIASPYKLRFRYERGALREYATFSWPLLIGSGSGVVMFQVPITIASRSLGAGAVGAITLASQITQYTRHEASIT